MPEYPEDCIGTHECGCTGCDAYYRHDAMETGDE